MRTATTEMELLRPASVEEALQMLRDHAPLRPLAGGTDVFVEANAGILEAGRFIDVWSLRELANIEVRDDLLVIGALASFSEIRDSQPVNERLPILVDAARTIGGLQIQNRATIGGNIANGSPAGDSLPVLAVAEATVVLRSIAGERRVPFCEFYTGYRQSVLAPDELIAALEIPPLEGEGKFRKVGTRAAQAISKIVMAAVVGTRPRIAVGSVAPTVVRLPRTEAVLSSGGSLEEATTALQSEIHPIDDVRSTAAYRRRVASNLLEFFFS